MVFGVIDFLQKTNERIRLYYYDTSGRLVFVRFLEETEKPFRNYLTFKNTLAFRTSQGKYIEQVLWFQVILTHQPLEAHIDRNTYIHGQQTKHMC